MENRTKHILQFAQTVEHFTAAQYMQNAHAEMSDAALHSVVTILNRMVREGRLQRVQRGLYAQSNLSPWQVVLTQQEKAIYDLLQSQFPLLKICTYNGETFAPLQHHLAFNQATYVEVERDGVEAVFHCLQDAGFIENWGRGYEKIHHEFDKAGLQQPVFEQLRGGMMATIQREVFLKIRGAQSVIAGTEQPTGNDKGNDTGNDRGNDLGKIKLIVCSLNREILRREELMTRMKLRSSSNYRDQYLYPAMAAGYVAMTLPDKPQSKNQKYYLTPKGIELLKQLNAN